MVPERKYTLLAAAPALLALGGALISQYGFNLHPCHLCILQRYPYAAILALAALGWLLRPSASAFKIVLIVTALLYVADSGIAAYHTGVEQGIIPGPESCTVQPGGGSSLDDIRAQILDAPLVACDVPAFLFLGLSMAAWNVLYALGCAGFIVWLARRYRKGKTV